MDKRVERVAELRRKNKLWPLTPAEIEELKDLRASVNADLDQIDAKIREDEEHG